MFRSVPRGGGAFKVLLGEMLCNRKEKIHNLLLLHSIIIHIYIAHYSHSVLMSYLVDETDFLGSLLLPSDARYENEMRRRIGLAKSTLTSMKKVLVSRNVAVRLGVLTCYVWSTLLYGVTHGLFLLSL